MNGSDDFSVLVVFGFLTVVGSVAVVMAIWSAVRRYQIRNETVLRLLESGQTLDQQTLEKLLSPPPRSHQKVAHRPTDPRGYYRWAGTVDFLIGFGTLWFAFTREGGVSYPLVALATLPIILAVYVWRSADKAFRDGSLPTINGGQDPRAPYHAGGGWLFFIGYATIFAGIVRDAGLSYPVIGLGILAMLLAILVWAQGEREYLEGLLTRPSSDPDTP